MLIMVGVRAIINMTGFDKMVIDNSDSEKCTISVAYKDVDGKPANYTTGTYSSIEEAKAGMKDIAAQLKDLEMLNVSTALENAIARGGTK